MHITYLLIILTFHTCYSIVNHRNCFTSDCRSYSCCSETQCQQNPLVHHGNSHQCPCMIPQTSLVVQEGRTIMLECNPGGVCLEYCEWTTPLGSCRFQDSVWVCEDPAIRFLFQEGTCNIEVRADTRHAGLWTCQASPYYNTYSDLVQVEVVQERMLGREWWRQGWSAAVLWSSCVVIILATCILILLCVCGVCSPLVWCRSRRSKSSEAQVEQENTGSTYERVGVLGNDMYGGGFTNRLSGVDYDEPRHYGGNQARTALNVTNLDAATLEERIGISSGIATSEQLI